MDIDLSLLHSKTTEEIDITNTYTIPKEYYESTSVEKIENIKETAGQCIFVGTVQRYCKDCLAQFCGADSYTAYLHGGPDDGRFHRRRRTTDAWSTGSFRGGSDDTAQISSYDCVYGYEYRCHSIGSPL